MPPMLTATPAGPNADPPFNPFFKVPPTVEESAAYAKSKASGGGRWATKAALKDFVVKNEDEPKEEVHPPTQGKKRKRKAAVDFERRVSLPRECKKE